MRSIAKLVCTSSCDIALLHRFVQRSPLSWSVCVLLVTCPNYIQTFHCKWTFAQILLTFTMPEVPEISTMEMGVEQMCVSSSRSSSVSSWGRMGICRGCLLASVIALTNIGVVHDSKSSTMSLKWILTTTVVTQFCGGFCDGFRNRFCDGFHDSSRWISRWISQWTLRWILGWILDHLSTVTLDLT